MANTLPGTTVQAPVRRLLRRRNTHEYFKEDGWTPNPSEARVFSDIIEAAEVCTRHKLTDVELILCVEDGRSEVFSTSLR